MSQNHERVVEAIGQNRIVVLSRVVGEILDNPNCTVLCLETSVESK